MYPVPSAAPFSPAGEAPAEVLHALRQLLKPAKNAVALVHPEMPMLGILWIPEQYILKTAGAQKYSKSQPHIPSLCLLFQHSRCNSREACNQIHVEREFAEQLRYLLNSSTISNCCRFHGDLASSNTTLLAGAERVELRTPGGPPLPIPAHHLAVTEYWAGAFSWTYLRDRSNVLFFPPSRVCNLHQRQACKYGSACKNVHICRDFWLQMMSPLPPPPRRPFVPQPQPAGFPLLPCGVHPAPESIAPAVPVSKRQSRALPIVDPTSGQEVSSAIVGQGDPCAPKDGKGFGEEGLALTPEHLDLISLALTLGACPPLFPLPLGLEADLAHHLPEGLAAERVGAAGSAGATPPNGSFSAPANRPGSPSNSSGTDASYGDDSGVSDEEVRKGPVPLYAAFWGSILPPPAL